MTVDTLTAGETTERTVERVASFDTYAQAERAVDRLADERFPVEHLQVVGRDLAFVEKVTGRRGFDRAASEGAISGALIAGFIGLLFGLLNWLDPLISGLLLALYGVVFGAAVGALVGLLVHAAASGRRDFSSARSLSANRYDILADAEVADDARTRLARLTQGEPSSEGHDDRPRRVAPARSLLGGR